MNAMLRRREAAVEGGEHADAARLEALVHEAREAGIARRVLLLRLSRLPRHAAMPHHLRLAREAITPLESADRARVFALANHDLVVVWRGDAQAALARTEAALAHLFEDEAALLPDPATLTALLDLPEEAEVLLAAVAESRRPDPFARTSKPTPTRPLDLAALAEIEAMLAQADIARMARRRPVCSRVDDGGLRLRWETRLLSIRELADAVAPGVDITGDAWLFRRLTRLLDRRLLALLAAPDELRGAGPFGLSLNVSAVLSPEFLRFDAALPSALRGQVVIGFAPWDMLSDPAAFLFARDFARARQYRLMLRGVSLPLAGLVPLRRSGLDLLELQWSAALEGADLDRLPIDMRRVVLSGLDTPQALAWAGAQAPAFVAGRLVQPSDRRRLGS